MDFFSRTLKVTLCCALTLSLLACQKNSGNRPVLQGPNGEPVSTPPGKDLPPAPNNPSSTPPNSTNPQASASGPLKLQEGRTELQARHTPWSSWWYPMLERELTRDSREQESPLKKYDRFLEIQTGNNPGAQMYQETEIYDDSYEDWAGYCDARAYASTLHAEPQKNAWINGVCFTPRDLKALLILTYSKVDPQGWNGVRGQPHNAFTRDLIDQDIFPIDFLKLVISEIGERRLPLLFDRDPSPEVWTESAYRAEIQIQKTTDPTKALGQLRLWAPSYNLTGSEKQKELLTGVGTIPIPFDYQFELTGKWQGSQFEAQQGAWIGTSRSQHPDFAIQWPQDLSQVKRQGANPRVQNEWVDFIIEQSLRAPHCP